MAYFLYAASACIALFVLFFLVLRDKKPQHYFMVIAFSCLSYILFFFGSELTGFIGKMPVLIHSDISVTFIAAPAIYFIFVSLMEENRRPLGPVLPFFVLPVLVTVFFAVTGFLHVSVGENLYPRPSVSVLSVLNFFSDAGFTFYFALALHHARSVRKDVTHRKGFLVMVVCLLCLFADSLYMLTAHVTGYEMTFYIASVIYSLIVIASCLVFTRIPEYILGNLKKPPVETPLLKKDEIATLCARLPALMVSKKLYQDPELSLKRLAREVDLNPHKLSWFINSELGMSFSEYVNGFRLDAVSKELLSDRNRPILEIAMNNGFGSKTAFNSLFVTRFGMSPREYRKRNGA
jgi:AraC-like DNA-binding protein